MKSEFRGFSFREHDCIPDKYEVVRKDSGVVKDDLSKDARNFTAFLYFCHLVQGSLKRTDLTKGKIVVIDDPVSSMDSGVLAIVGTFVNELNDDCFCEKSKMNIQQTFILTHNPYFQNAASQALLRPDEMYYKMVTFF